MSDPTPPRLGLVLSGGGSKGAYQVGVVRYLAEKGWPVEMLAGASIGSLNAAVLASSSDLHSGAQRLESLWAQVAAESPIQLNPVAVGQLIVLALAKICAPKLHSLLGDVSRIAALLGAPTEGLAILRNDPVRAILERSVDPGQLQAGLPLWVSVYESRGLGTDLTELIPALLGLGDTRPSRFLCIQDLEVSQRTTALLASAAIPLAFQAQMISGTRYVDGGMGGWKSVQGNTPITPLVNAGCTHVVVSHLSDGSLWNRHDFPDTTIVEIRPRGIERDGPLTDVVGFKTRSIESWIEQGYEDTRRCLGEVEQSLVAVHRGNVASDAAAAAARGADDAVGELRRRPFKVE